MTTVERDYATAAEKPAARLAAARMLKAIAARIAPGVVDSEDGTLVAALDRLAQLDAEMDRLRTRRPAGWANTITVYAAEADQIRREMALEYKRDDTGSLFLVRGQAALYYLPSAPATAQPPVAAVPQGRRW